MKRLQVITLTCLLLLLSVWLTAMPTAAQDTFPTITWTKILETGVYAADFSPDGTYIAYGDKESENLIMYNWREDRILWQQPGNVLLDMEIKWSPDGKYIATVYGMTTTYDMQLFDAATGEPMLGVTADLQLINSLLEKATNSEGMGFADMRWGRDSTEIAVMAYGFIVVYNISEKTVSKVVDILGGLQSDLRVIFGVFDWNPESGRFAALRHVEINGEIPFPVEVELGFWNERGIRIAQPAMNGTRSPESNCMGDGRGIFNGFATFLSDPVFSPDGTMIALYDNNAFIVCTPQMAGNPVIKIVSQNGAGVFHWTNDQRWLFADEFGCGLLVVDIANDFETRDISTEDDCISGLSGWTADDRFVVAGGELGVWIGEVVYP